MTAVSSTYGSNIDVYSYSGYDNTNACMLFYQTGATAVNPNTSQWYYNEVYLNLTYMNTIKQEP